MKCVVHSIYVHIHICVCVCVCGSFFLFLVYTYTYLSKIWLVASKVIQMSTVAGQYLPTIGSTLLLSIEYIDLGKWVAAIEGGAHMGLHLILVVLFFNCSGILCQYLANLIGIVMRKNLAQVFSLVLAKFECLDSFVLDNFECSLP